MDEENNLERENHIIILEENIDHQTIDNFEKRGIKFAF